MPISDCLADTNIYQKAKMFNMPGIRINGNNVVEVFETAKKAIENARSGNGPALLECLTYRWRGHVGPNYDLDKELRSQEEFDYWMSRCPIAATEKWLLDKGFISGAERDRIHEAIEQEVSDALAFALGSPYPVPGTVLDYVTRTGESAV